MTTVRPLSVPPASPRVQDMTRVRPPELGVGPVPAGPSSAPALPRASIPAAGEINRQVRRKRSGMLALYWSAGIVAMLTAGGILTAMIARGDADALIQRQNAPAPAAQPTTIPAAVAAPVAPEEVKAEAPAAKKPAANVVTAIPGTKPGQIVDLQLWKGRPNASGSATGGSAPTAGGTAPAAGTPPMRESAGAAPVARSQPTPKTITTPSTNSNVKTPDNDPAVRMARDQLESSFK